MSNESSKKKAFRQRTHVRALLVAAGLGLAFACGTSRDESPSTVPAVIGIENDAADGTSPDADTTDKPPLPPAPSPEGNVVTYAPTSLGLTGLSVNGRIQPHGAATDYYFEYGVTTAYGGKTPTKAVAPKLAAFYHESWDTSGSGTAGWQGGSGNGLTYVASGGTTGGFVRYTEPTGNDYNHQDGVGIIHLIQYFYPGIFSDEFAPSAAFGGTDPDLRDAKVHVSVRGVNWQPSGTELVWWSQIDVTHGKPPPTQDPAFSNWAHTGFALTDSLFSGNWEPVDYRLWNDTTDWTYAGTNAELNAEINRSVYVYAPLDEVLTHMDIDLFHVLVYADPYHPSTGSIDFDDFEIAYRNHSVLLPSNGGKLTSFPPGSPDSTDTLTDGWRNGTGKTWKSAPSPQAPLEFLYTLDKPVLIDRVLLHQHPDWPSKDVEVLASSNGTDWTPIVTDTIPQSAPMGANFTYLFTTDISTFLDQPSTQIKVRVLSGYRPEAWGLGEIEVFGSGASMKTEDDWYRVNADITGLTPGQTIHYRLVAVTNGKAELGGDLTFVVPADATPQVTTGPATRIAAGSAKVEGRLNTLGQAGQMYFEYGTSLSYGQSTDPKPLGTIITPRTVVDRLDGLVPGTTIHFRLVVSDAAGTTYGKDATFLAR